MDTSANSGTDRINLAALKRADPYILNILTSTAQVALYQFEDKKWEKTETEGTLFVYERQGDPKYGFIVLNRLSPKNLIEPVTKELDFQLQKPFLLYKNKEGNIFGIWFFDGEACEQISDKIQSLVAQTESETKVNEKKATNEDLSTMLAKAGKKSGKPTNGSSDGENKLMKLLASGGSGPGSSGKKQRQPPSPPQMTEAINGTVPAVAPSADGGKNNVAAFFARVEEQQQQHQQQPPPPSAFSPLGGAATSSPMNMPHPMMAPMMTHPGMMPFLPLVPQVPMNAQAMGMMNPAMMGMHPRPPLPGMINPGMQPSPTIHGPSLSPQPEDRVKALARLMSNPGAHSLEDVERQQRLESMSPERQMPPLPPTARSADDLESQMRENLQISENEARSYADAAGSAKKAPKIMQVIADTDEPKLLSPMDFAQSSKKVAKVNGGLKANNKSNVDVTPLTQSQLMQAFQHLLKTDPSFIAKLHQAYVESMNTKLH